MYKRFSEMHGQVEEKLKEAKVRENDNKDAVQAEAECQVFNIGVEDELELDGIMRQIQKSGKIEDFMEHYAEIQEIKKRECVPTARAPYLAKTEKARRDREKRGQYQKKRDEDEKQDEQ